MDMQIIVFIIGVCVLIASSIFYYFGRKSVAFTKRGSQFTKLKLIDKVVVTHNTRRFRIALQTKDTIFGLPIGNHINLRFIDVNGDEVIRPYTPTSSKRDIGYFEIVVKIYPEGKMGQYLDHLAIGDMIDVRGPTGSMNYDRPSHITLRRPRKSSYFNFKTMNMIAGGTGLTPMYQVIQCVISNPLDHTDVRLIYGNISEDDILCQEDLEKMREAANVDIVFTLDKPPSGWKEESGYVTVEMIRKYLAPPEEEPVNLICGPPPMMRAVKATLSKMGYPKERVLSF